MPPQPPVDPLQPEMFSLGRHEHPGGISTEAGFGEVALKATDVPIHGKDTTQTVAFITQAARCLRSSKMPRASSGYAPQKRFHNALACWTRRARPECGAVARIGVSLG